MYVYPLLNEKEEVITAENIELHDETLKPIYNYFKEHGQIIDIENFELKNLKIFSHTVLRKIKENDDSWENDVPETVANLLKENQLFRKKGGLQCKDVDYILILINGIKKPVVRQNTTG